MGAAEHRQSKREWNQLLAICHSAQDACATGPDGRYVRSDAEQLYQLSRQYDRRANHWLLGAQASLLVTTALFIDRKSTRLNSSHGYISYAVFCLKKKKKKNKKSTIVYK